MHEAPPLSTSRFILLVAAGFASGCALAPYEETFQCPLSSNYGACTDVSGAYADAVAAPAVDSHSVDTNDPDGITRSRGGQRLGVRAAPHPLDAAAELATPSVIPPTLLRTWVGAFQDADGTLFAPRYVFHMAGESRISGNGHTGARTPIDAAIASPLLLPTVPR
jgi:hypothetical protein